MEDAKNENGSVLTRELPHPLNDQVCGVSFNQDFTSLQIGTQQGFQLFEIIKDGQSAELQDQEVFSVPEVARFKYRDVFIIERHFRSSLIIVVTKSEPQLVRVCHFRNGAEIASFLFRENILAVRLNRSKLIVCLEQSIQIYHMRDMRVAHMITEDVFNREGIIALSPDEKNSLLAFPKSSLTGQVVIFDTTRLSVLSTFLAHRSPVVIMQFDSTGTKLATASSQGTVIRIHNAAAGDCLFELRRGLMRTAAIHSLAFSPDGMFLASSSNTGTIHIFSLVPESQRPEEPPATLFGSFTQLVTRVATYIPGQTGEVFSQDRAFATIHLALSACRTVLAMNTSKNILKLFVAGYDGNLHVYEVAKIKGGECRLITEVNLQTLTVKPARPTPLVRAAAPPQNSPRDNQKHPPVQDEVVRRTQPSDRSATSDGDFKSLPVVSIEEQ